MRSVFDVSLDILKVSGQDSLPTLTLQKLVFYTYGWYAHLTGSRLFEQSFYAMPKGPVVGELLTAHARRLDVDRDVLEMGRELLEDEPQPEDPYYIQIIEAVWGYYGKFSRWELVDMTHEEQVWRDAWDSRREGSRRAPLEATDIIDYFALKRDIPEALRAQLPDPLVERLTESEWAHLEAVPVVAHAPFFERLMARVN